MKIQELVVDLLLEILLRLPPEPINLCYASLVCKGWRGLVNDASFLRRFREFHGGTPPFLGFFGNNPKSIYDGVNNDQPPRPLFVPTFGDFAASTAAKMSHTDWRAHDSRHGRALLESLVSGTLLVWDLVTGDKHHLPSPHLDHDSSYQHNGTLLCAAGHTVTDHRDCRSCPFLVVYVFCPDESAICVCVWSSETGVWSEITSMEIFGRMEPMPPALVGNTLYWLLEYRVIIQYDLDNRTLGRTEELPLNIVTRRGFDMVIMTTEDGRLGLAGFEGRLLHLWSLMTGIDGLLTWTLQRVIDLKKYIAPEPERTCLAVGFAEEAGAIFFYVRPRIYMIHLKSRKIEEVSQTGYYGTNIIPYSSFYAPGWAFSSFVQLQRQNARLYLSKLSSAPFYQQVIHV